MNRLFPALAAAAAGLFLMAQTGCAEKTELEPVAIAVSRQPVSAPVYVGHDKKFFEREGLTVRLQQYWTGKEALDAVVEGKADFSTVAETPVMFAAFNSEPVLIVATIADSDNYMKIVARKDRGIAAPRDLKGKTIGVSIGTNAQYFLDAYLTFHGVSHDRVATVPMKPEAMADALIKGSVDAAVSWEPHVAAQSNLLGGNAVVFENREIYQILWNLVGGRPYVLSHAETVGKLLRALLRAQEYIAGHQEEARTITAGYVGDAPFSLADFNFDLRLGQSLVLDLEEQSRWAIRRGLTRTQKLPNFLDLFYFKGMEAVAPESVTVPHR